MQAHLYLPAVAGNFNCMNLNISKWKFHYQVLGLFGWLALAYILMFMNYDYQQPLLPQWIATVLGLGMAFPPCYYALKTLVPQYLYKRRIRIFISFFLLVAFVNTIITYLATFFLYHLLTGLPMFRSVSIVISISFAILFFDIIAMAASCIIKIIGDRFFMEQQLLSVEKEKLSTELNFLRSQVNPHFLFNVMNTIYFQIDRENTSARASVDMLSEMMRYQLYECTTDKIDIVKEVEYIKNYVAMQKLRMETGTDVKLVISNNLSGFDIAPLLLLPLIENAFKHVSNYKEASRNLVHVTLTREGSQTFTLNTVNTYDQLHTPVNPLPSGGLGMQNLKRRLGLLYPGRHELHVTRHDNQYITTLKLLYD